MNLLTPKFARFVLNLLIIGIIIVASYFIFKTTFKWLLPFILACVIASIVEPVVKLLQVKLKFPRKLASIVTVLFTILIFSSVIIFLIYRVIYEIRELAKRLPEFIDMFSQEIIRLFDKGVALYIELPSEVTIFVDSVLKNFAQNLTENLTELLPSATEATKLAYNVAKSLPSALIFFIILVSSTYFISSDKEKIISFIKQQIPPKWLNNIIIVKNDLLFALGGYIKAQLILMCITFIEVSIGLLLMRVDYAILLALFISIIDALPILGVGTILIPWAIISFILGNYQRGFPLIMLYGIVLLVRQLLEPKVLGGQIGLYPLVVLISMYVGLQILGFVGMIIGPTLVLILVNLHKSGIFKLWKE